MTEHLARPSVSVRSVISGPYDDVLILQRSSDGEWELPGGRLGSSEGVSEGLHREIDEETSLSVDIEDILLANSWVNDRNDDRLGVYYVSTTDRKRVRLSEEHVDFKWLDPADAAYELSTVQAKAVRLSDGEANREPVLDV